jgi:hypothetical protein
MTAAACSPGRIAIIRANAKIHVVRSVPLIFHGLYKQNGIAQPELDWTFIGFVAGIASTWSFILSSSVAARARCVPACRLDVRAVYLFAHDKVTAVSERM